MNLATISADSNAVVVFCSLKNRYSYNVASYIFLNDILPIPYFTMGTDNTLLIVNSCNIYLKINLHFWETLKPPDGLTVLEVLERSSHIISFSDKPC